MPEVLSVNEASKQFGNTKALEGTSFTLQRGEYLALLGPNGAGKTTCVRAIAGQVTLDEGTINLLGAVLNTSVAGTEARQKLGVVPQDIALYPMLTARENLQTFGSLHGLKGRHLIDRVTHALVWTGLADRADELTRAFSGGMKRRLNIACGVLHEPKVILLDEPTVGVDPQSRQRIWEMLSELQQQGASLLLTTHQLDEAQQVCQRIIVIDHGKVIAQGTFNDLVHQTIGTKRLITCHLDAAPSPSLLDYGFEFEDNNIAKCRVDNVAAELPRLIEQIHASGGEISDMHIESPTLQAVFIHLTGRELRE